MLPFAVRSGGTTAEVKAKKLFTLDCCGEKHEIWICSKGRLFSPQHPSVKLEQFFHAMRESKERDIPICVRFISRWNKFLTGYTNSDSMIGMAWRDEETFQKMQIIRSQISNLRRHRITQREDSCVWFGQDKIKDRLYNYARILFRNELKTLLQKFDGGTYSDGIFLNVELTEKHEPVVYVRNHSGRAEGEECYIKITINPTDWMKLYTEKKATRNGYILLGLHEASSSTDKYYLAMKPDVVAKRLQFNFYLAGFDSAGNLVTTSAATIGNTSLIYPQDFRKKTKNAYDSYETSCRPL